MKECHPFTPYSLEEQVVADYLQSLTQAPCATIKLDAQDNPYIGSMLYTAADLRRCGMLDKGREEAIIRAWRLFKRLLYYSVEGERLFTGFAILTNYRSLSYYRQHWPSLLWFHEANYTSLDQGLQGLRQFLLNADGRSTFLATHNSQIVGLLKLVQGTQRQLTTAAAWRTVLPLATISSRGRISFWVALKGRKNPRIRLSLLEYRQGHLHIPLFQDIFWQELERQLKEVCPGCHLPRGRDPAPPQGLAGDGAPQRPRGHLSPGGDPEPVLMTPTPPSKTRCASRPRCPSPNRGSNILPAWPSPTAR